MSYSMSLNQQQRQTQSLKQTQRLIMSPQMQQAINLLQMPVLELAVAIEQELAQNPILEGGTEEAELPVEVAEAAENEDALPEEELLFNDRDYEILRRLDEDFRDHFAESASPARQRTSEDDKLQTFLESSISGSTSLYDHLLQQAHETFEERRERQMAEVVIGHFDQRGFLQTPLEEIALLEDFPLAELREILEEIQEFEPHGVGAADLRESLLIQLRCMGKGKSLAYEIIQKHYDDLLHNRIPTIKRSLGRSPEEIRDAIESTIARLDLQPGTNFDRGSIQYITPDVRVYLEGEELLAEIYDETMPPLRVNSRYLRMLENPDLPQETKEYIHKKLMSGKWLIRNIHQRNETILRITQSLIRRQREFFLDPRGQLHPLTMKAVAEELQIHESTVARAVANKYVDTPRGLLPLRSFFTNSCVTKEGEDVSSHDVKHVLQDLIDTEDKKKPLSDQALSDLVKARGIDCARRTVAKYRIEMKLGNASQRRMYS